MDYGLRKDDELIDLIYAAMLGETSWGTFLDRLSDNAPDGRTILFSHNMSQSDDYLAMTSRCEGPEIESYAAHYVDVNPWLPHCAVRKVGLGVYSDQIVPLEDLFKTEFYNDWLRPNGVACSVGVTIDKHGTCPLIISTVTSRADPELNSLFSDQFSRIAPHLRRAARFYQNGPARWSGFNLDISLFDSVNIGAMIVGEDGRIKTISTMGQELLDGGTCAFISPLGQVRLRSGEAQSVLQDMLKRTYTGQKTVSLSFKGLKLTLIRIEKDHISLYFEGPTIVILMERSGSMAAPYDPQQFAGTYKLTPAEMRALQGIVEGKSVNQIADEASVSRETIRSQLKSLYAKVGVNGQTDLLRLVFGGGRSG